MKHTSFLRMAAAVAFVAGCGEAMATDIIRQKQLETGFVQDVVLTSQEGSGLMAPVELDNLGADFELWGASNTAGEPPLLLDTERVTAYGLTGSITVVSEDPYDGRLNGVYRTRADRPYYYRVEGQNFLLTGPDYTRELVFTHDVTSYPANKHAPANGGGLTNSDSYLIDSTNPVVEKAELTSVPGTDATKREGEEVFTLSTKPGDLESVAVDQVKVMVYPVSTATISGLQSGDKILHTPPGISVSLENLYPWSETWGRIYAGDYNPDNENGNFIEPIYMAYWNRDPAADPLTTTLTLSDWGELLPKDGKYTIEILTQTPFNDGKPEVLTHVTFDVDRTVEVNGQIFTSE